MIVKFASMGGGIVSDEIPHELADGQWSSGLNVRFHDGYAQRTEGHADVLTAPSAATYMLAPYRAGGKDWWVHATLTGVFADDGSAKSTITGTALTGGATDKFTATVLGGVLCFNNQKDSPRYWGGNTAVNTADLTGWNSNWKCKSLRAFKNYLLALNVTKTSTNYPAMVKWSHAADPGTIPASWDEADATLDAGEFDLADTDDEIVDGLPLGDTFVVYKSRSMYGMQFIGGNAIFRQFRLPGSHGIMSQNCAAQTPVGHVVLTSSADLVVHQGNEPQSILTGRMRRWLQNEINTGAYYASFVVHHPTKDEVWACFAATGSTSCNRALIWNYRANTFAVRSLPSALCGASGPVPPTTVADNWNTDAVTWSGDSALWDPTQTARQQILMATVGSELYAMDVGNTFDGSAIAANVERTGVHLGTPEQVKTLRAVYPRIEGSGTVTIQCGGAMDIEAPVTWSPAVTYTIGSSYKADTFATGRFLAIRISSSDASTWRLRGLDWDVIPRGIY